MNLSDEIVNEIHSGNRTKLNYNLAWAKNYLKAFEVIENTQRGIWTLTEKGFKIDKVDEQEVSNFVLEKNIRKKILN